MKTRKAFSINVICFFIVSFFILFPEYLYPETTVLRVPKKSQKQNQWCWAGCSDAVLSFYGKKIKQCYMANFAWSQDDCCSTPANCNSPNSMYGTAGSLQGILKHWCVSSQKVTSSLTFSSVKSEIKNSRPLIIRYGWATGGGHFIVIRGCKVDKSGENEKLYLMDPWPGNGYGIFSYTYVKHEADHHTWTHTLEKIKKTKSAASWKPSNSRPVAGYTCSGYSPCWKFTLYLKENKGGCGKVEKFYWYFYDKDNKFINSQSNAKKDFSNWFDDCGDGDYQLPRDQKVCADLWVQLGGRTSGYVKLSFVIKCDKGNTVTVSRKFRLPESSSAQGTKKESNYFNGAGGVFQDTRNLDNRDHNSEGCKNCNNSISNSDIEKNKGDDTQ